MEPGWQVMKVTSKVFYVNAVLRSATRTVGPATTKWLPPPPVGFDRLTSPGCLSSTWVSIVVLQIHSSEGFIRGICACVYECFKVWFQLSPAPSVCGHSLNSCSGNPEGQNNNKPEKSQPAAVCLCPHGETAETRPVDRRQSHDSTLVLINFSPGLPLPLHPTGGTSHRWRYFNYVSPGVVSMAVPPLRIPLLPVVIESNLPPGAWSLFTPVDPPYRTGRCSGVAWLLSYLIF